MWRDSADDSGGETGKFSIHLHTPVFYRGRRTGVGKIRPGAHMWPIKIFNLAELDETILIVGVFYD